MQTTNKKHIKAVRAAVESIGHYNPADDIVIEHAALLLTMIDQARAEVQNYIQVFPSGAEQIAPQVNNLRGLISDFQGFADKLGLTPAARKKLGVEPAKKETAKSSLMAMRNAKSG